MFKRLIGVGVGALTVLAAGCDSVPTTQQVYQDNNGLMSYVRYASAGGPMLVQVYGNPFAADPQRLDAVAAKELGAGLAQLGGVRLTTDAKAAPRPEYRVVMLLGADKAQDANALCASKDAVTADAAMRPSRMITVFCRKDELLSEVTGSIQPPAAPEDAGFRAWVRQIGTDLFQQRDDHEHNRPDVPVV